MKRLNLFTQLLLIVMLIIAVITYISLKNQMPSKQTEKPKTSKDDNYYTMSWREPQAGEEVVSLARVFVSNNINGCGMFYVKNVDSGKYLVACSDDGETWQYYITWPDLNEIYSANDEMNSRITPPKLD